MSTLKELREEKVLTQEELAARIGVTKQMIWYWEKGLSMPRPVHIRKLAEIYGKEPGEMRKIIEANLVDKELAAVS